MHSKITFLLIALFTLSIVCSCEQQTIERYEKSGKIYEEAVVMKVMHSTCYETEVEVSGWNLPQYKFFGKIFGGSGVNVKKFPAKYMAVLACEHGTILFYGKEAYDKYKDMVGKKVKIAFEAEYHTSYSVKGEIKNKKLISTKHFFENLKSISDKS